MATIRSGAAPWVTLEVTGRQAPPVWAIRQRYLIDLMNRAAQAAGTTREPFLFYGAAALLYLAFTTLSELGFAWAARRLAIGTRKAAL